MLAIVRQYHDNAIPHYIQINYLNDIPAEFKENKHKPKAFLAAAIAYYNEINKHAEAGLLNMDIPNSELDLDLGTINSDSDDGEKVQKQSPRSSSSNDSNSKLTEDVLQAFNAHTKGTTKQG